MDLHFGQHIFLFFAAVIAGTLNALAGLAASTIAHLKRLNAPTNLLIPLLATRR